MVVKYAAEIGGMTDLLITKLDVLDGQQTIRVGVGYELDGREIDCFPAGIADYGRCRPIYQDFPGWTGSVCACRTREDLPREAREYLQFIEEFVGLPIKLISVGPGREETIVLEKPFA